MDFQQNSCEGVRGGDAAGGDGDLCPGGRPLAREGERERGGEFQRNQAGLAAATLRPVDIIFKLCCVLFGKIIARLISN